MMEEGAEYAVRVVAEDAAGRKVALSHFNKKANGEFVKAVLASGIDHDGVDSLIDWAQSTGIRLEKRSPGELDLVQ